MKRNEFLRFSASAAFGTAVFPTLFGGRRPPEGAHRVPATAPGAPPGTPPGTEEERYWEFVRAQFPLETTRAYLNTGGLGASPYPVIDAVTGKIGELEKICETGHADSVLDEIRKDAGALLGCDGAELAFTRNTTEGINIVANGLPLRRGDEVILTTQEHVANAFTWLALAKREGIVLRLFEPSTVSDAENIDALTRCITQRTRLISIPHALTTTGTILPVAQIARIAREKRIWFFVDGAQTAGMFPFSLHEIGCDAYATSGHKWLLGPKETGLLYVRREMLDTIAPKFVGAYSGGDFDIQKGTVSFNPAAQRYEYGTVSMPLRAGLGAAIAFIRSIGIGRIWDRDRMLSDALVAGLGALPDVLLVSPARAEMRTAMVTIQHRTLPHEKLQAHLDTYNLRTRSVTEGGMHALRLSFHLYNTPGEVARVLEALRTAPKG
jgi:selenocysteine lyase/cysteine desulfurase